MISISELSSLTEESAKPFTCVLELTHLCNFKCPHCYLPTNRYHGLEYNRFKKLVDIINEFNFFIINITGGEPLTHPYFCDIYTYIKERGLITTLLTNGYLINQRIVDLLKNYPPHSVEISLYGSNSDEYLRNTGVTNGFQTVMSNIHLLLKNNINTVIKTVLTNYNINNIYNYIKVANRFGLELKVGVDIYPQINGNKNPLKYRAIPRSICQFETQTKELDNINEHIAKAEKRYIHKNIHCSSGLNSFLIDPQGTIALCNWMRLDINIFSDKFEKLWLKLQEIRKELEIYAKKSKCMSCNYRGICTWCPVYAYLENKQYTKPIQYFCDLAKERNKFFNLNLGEAT